MMFHMVGVRIAAALLAILVVAPPAAAQDRKVPRIGYLISAKEPGPFEQAFLKGLREQGHEPGRSIVVEFRSTEGSPERTRAALEEFGRSKVDVIVSPAAQPAKVARVAAPGIPFVFTAAADPVGDGVVESLARPGGQATGFSVHAPEFAPKRMEALKDAVPGLTRMGVAWSRSNPRQGQIEEAVAAARALGIQVDLMPLAIPDELDAALARAARDGVGGVFFLSDISTITHRAAIGAAALRHRVPTLMSNRAYLAGNTLMSFGPDVPDLHRQAAGLVERILRGAKPGDIPVAQPTRFEFVVNLGVARQLGLALPPTTLARADEVIE